MAKPEESTPVGGGTKCSFCGKSQDDVRVIVTSRESAICDECVFLALDVISGEKNPLYLRVSYAAFKIIATIGHRLTYGLRRTK